jgi:nucleoside-diphosphate-sugar epimerase
MDWKDKKVMVTGSEGLIGKELVRLLINLGAKVTRADLKLDNDLTSYPYVEYFLRTKRPEYIFHLAGVKGNPKMTNERPVDFMRPMLQFDTNLIYLAQIHKVKQFLYTSSIAVEHVESDYYPAWAKLTAETLINAMRVQYPDGTKYCVVRPANVYGKEDLNRKGLMVISDLIKKARKFKKIQLMTDGEEERDFIHASDVARAMVTVMEMMPQKPIAIGSGIGTKIKDIAKIIAEGTNSELILSTEKAQCQSKVMDIKALRQLGFKPEIKIEEGIKELIQ